MGDRRLSERLLGTVSKRFEQTSGGGGPYYQENNTDDNDTFGKQTAGFRSHKTDAEALSFLNKVNSKNYDITSAAEIERNSFEHNNDRKINQITTH